MHGPGEGGTADLADVGACALGQERRKPPELHLCEKFASARAQGAADERRNQSDARDQYGHPACPILSSNDG